jgi:superfamily II DNA/RNA helicase
LINEEHRDLIVQASSGEGKTLCAMSVFLNSFVKKIKLGQNRTKLIFVYSSFNLCIQQYKVIKDFCEILNNMFEQPKKISTTLIVKKSVESGDFCFDPEEQKEE